MSVYMNNHLIFTIMARIILNKKLLRLYYYMINYALVVDITNIFCSNSNFHSRMCKHDRAIDLKGTLRCENESCWFSHEFSLAYIW